MDILPILQETRGHQNFCQQFSLADHYYTGSTVYFPEFRIQSNLSLLRRK